MEWHEIEVNGRRTVKFSEKILQGQLQKPAAVASDDFVYDNKIGGIIKRGAWAWLANGSTLQIVSLRTGQTVSSFDFNGAKGYDSCCIKCVEEVFPGNTESVLLAICLESYRGPGGGSSFISLYSVEHSNVLSRMELRLHITSARFMDSGVCRRSLLQNFDGCLAVGSEEGVLILLDLNMRKLLSLYDERSMSNRDTLTPCRIVDYSLSLTEIHRCFRQCQNDDVHFGLQVEVIESPTAIQCILPIDLILGLAIGLEDGRLAFYDLAELQIIYITQPEESEEKTPLVKMDFLEPPDDPRPCLYVWAMHESEQSLTAVLHTLMYEKRLNEDDDSSFFETFQNSSVRLRLPLETTKSIALACQSITKLPTTHAEDDSHCLCALSWYSEMDEKNKLLIFDLNQWYKEEMPFVLHWKKQPSYLAGYVLNGQKAALTAHLDATTIAHFNSMQRFEEHFYPNSLSFDSLLLLWDACRSYNWEGSQNRVINILRCSNATIFLEPNAIFNEILRARLMPQFSDLNINATFSKNAKYELLLSVALEHNCFSLLRDCAKCWADGSFMGNLTTSTGISLSTLTDWIWKRATDIKKRCQELCKGLFDCARYPLDAREQKELGFITRELKLLADLLAETLRFSKRHIPEKVFTNLDSKYNSLRIAADYQSVLLWLLNIGLLPEAEARYGSKSNSYSNLVPYPYTQLKVLYTNKRTFFSKISDSFISKKTGSCRLIYIDAFIEHECKGSVLREYWLENKGNGLYPPTSIESMLRVMLVPDVAFDSKCAILLYFFLDLHMAIDEQEYKSVVANFIKFPSVFKLSAALIKTVQAFWNLDHGHFLPAVDEFISPFNNNQNYPQWLLELLIESLLTQNVSNLALRLLEARPTLVSPVLKLKTLLSNELISEAFHFARSKHDDSLLELFFSCCLCAGKFGVIRDLALSEKEGQLVQHLLRRSKMPGAENLHFVYLLQKSKYIEAVSYMDELSKAKTMRSNLNNSNIDTPNLVLSAFNTTMTPVTQGLTDVYFRIKNKIKKKEADNKSPVPLSCQLIKQNANNLLGGIYHSSALSAHFATYYWSDMNEKKRDAASHLLNYNNAPFLRKPQIETHFADFRDKNNISYPQTYTISEKRTLTESDLHNNSSVGAADAGLDTTDTRYAAQQNPKKRRRLIGEEIINDLQHFMQMNKNSSRLNVSEFSFKTAEEKHNKPTAVTSPVSLMTQPLIKQQQRDADNYAKPSLRTELHGILKTNTPEPTRRQSLCRELPMEEEKNLRFRLPSAELDKSSLHKDVTMAIVKEHIVADAAEMETDTPKQRKPVEKITRSISVDSNDSSTSSKSHSGETFYSPLSSKNHSLTANSGHDAMTVTNVCSSNLESYVTAPRFPDSPQPRKPLARLSAERSEKSETPQLTTKRTPERSLTKTSSGFSSATMKSEITSAISTTSSCSSALPVFAITSVKSLSSKISDFTPLVCSSKVCETQSKFIAEPVAGSSGSSRIKLTECSTVVGDSTLFIDTTEELAKAHSFAQQQQHLGESTDQQLQEKVLDTTLGMSSYDLTVLETLPLEQSKATLTKSTNDTEMSVEDNEQSSEDDENMADMDLYEEALGLNKSSNAANNKFESSQQTADKLEHELDANSANAETQDDAVIVLSSSSSSEDDENRSDDAIECTSDSDIEIEFGNVRDNDDDDDDDDDDDYDDDIDEDEEENENEYNEDDGDDEVFDIDGEHEEESKESNEVLEPESEDDLQMDHNPIEIVVQTSDDDDDSDNDSEQFSNEAEDVAETSNKSKTVEKETANIPAEEHVEQAVADSSTNKEDNINITEQVENSAVKDQQQLMEETNENTEKTKEDKQKLEKTEAIISSNIAAEEVSKAALTEQTVLKKADDAKTQAEAIIENELVISKDGNKEYEMQTKDSELKVKEIEIRTEQEKTENVSSENMEVEDSIKLHVGAEDDLSENKESSAVKQSEEKAAVVIAAESSENAVHTEESIKDSFVVVKTLEKDEEIVKKSADNLDKSETQNDATVAKNKTISILEEENRIEAGNRKSHIEIKETEQFILTPKKRRSLRGTSVPSVEVQIGETSVPIATPRSTRGISVPPQTLAESTDADNVLTPHTLRNSLRAKSLFGDGGTPGRRKSVRATSVPAEEASERTKVTEAENTPKARGRGISVPPGEVTAKIVTRRTSALLDAIGEDADVALDSPSTRTRSRMRQNSMESDGLDSSIKSNEPQSQTKRVRRTSISSNVSEQLQTPRRTRRQSISSQVDIEAAVTPNVGRSLKRKKSTDEPLSTSATEETENQSETNKEEKTSPTTETSISPTTYSETRRLTRTQLAIMEKSAVISAAVAKAASTSAAAGSMRRITKRRISRSTAGSNLDSEDAESISSHVSNISNATTGIKRRVTRSSVKDKEEVEDDLVSNVSSIGSERRRKRRSNEKISPNTTLSAIPEDEAEEPVEPKKRGRPAKH